METKYHKATEGYGPTLWKNLRIKIVRSWLPWVLMISLCLALSAAWGDLTQVQAANKSFASQNSLQLARRLLNDRHYQEAISFIEQRLKIQAPTEPRLPLLLLLADALMGISDLDRAEATLNDAESLVVRPADQKAVEKRRLNVEKLRLRLPLSTEASPEEIAAEETVVPYQAEGSMVTNSFFETDLRQVLTDIAMETGVPILWDATIQGLVTYDAKGQPLEDVLKAILLPMGFTYLFKEGTYFVGSAKPGDPAFELLSKTDVVLLQHLKAGEAIDLLSQHFQDYVKASSETSNMVCITAPQTTLERIKQDLMTIDAPPTQIMIEVIVTEISTDALRQIGLDWSLADTLGNTIWGVAVDNANLYKPPTLGSGGIPTTPAEYPPLYGAFSRSDVAIGNYAVDLFASLEGLVQSGDAKIRANPRITTMNSRTASISLTRDQYFLIQTGTSLTYQYNTLQSISSGITLEITPYASETGEITVLIKPQVDDVVGESSSGYPEISRRAASTTVRVKNGETFTVGGLSIQQEKNNQKKIPFLGDIPVLGYLFRYDSHDVRESEIIIFVTPHILND